MSKPEIYIDGLNVFMRHFAANPSRSINGRLCGGIVGMLKNIQTLTERFNPCKVIVVWEGGGSLRRRNIDPNYKSGRRPVKLNRSELMGDIPDTVENRDYQLKTLIKILYKTPVTQIYVNDCEADDIISYLCKTKNNLIEKIIVTSDKDYYQLINDNIKIWAPNRKILIDEQYVKSKWNIPPHNFCLARCFTGDQSDGIKGVKGAGFKVMTKRFPELSTCNSISINDIINMSNDKIKNGSKLKLLNEIVNNKSNIEKNWKLMYLDSAMVSADQVKSINFQYDNKEEKLNKMDLLKIMNREGLNMFDIHSFFLTLKVNIRT